MNASSPGFGPQQDSRLAEFLDKQEVTELLLRFHALLDRWEWEKAAPLEMENSYSELRIDGIPVRLEEVIPHDRPFTSWREVFGVRGQHQWLNILVTLEGADAASVYMTGTQTNTYRDGVSETSGLLQHAVCRRTVGGWRIAEVVGSYESNHGRLSEIFAAQLEGHTPGRPG